MNRPPLPKLYDLTKAMVGAGEKLKFGSPAKPAANVGFGFRHGLKRNRKVKITLPKLK
jgi:hypothetical protein